MRLRRAVSACNVLAAVVGIHGIRTRRLGESVPIDGQSGEAEIGGHVVAAGDGKKEEFLLGAKVLDLSGEGRKVDERTSSPSSAVHVGKDFYEFVNHDWLSDPTIVIPPEYPKWGSFVELVDDSVKNQISVLKEIVGSAADADEEKLANVWRASIARLEGWSRGEGDYSAVLEEFNKLDEDLSVLDEDVDGYVLGLAKYLSRAQQVGIGGPLGLETSANLLDTENLVLTLSPGGTSLPARAYYFDSKFESHRGWFKEHLAKVVELVGVEHLEDNFVSRVLRIETKLACIQMKKDQSRQYDQYFTVTTFDELVTDINKMKYLESKESNYGEYQVDDKDQDRDVLMMAGYNASAEDMLLIGKFFEQMSSSMGLRDVMATNYAKYYPQRNDAAEAQYRMMVFDGDYFRRVFRLLFRKGNRRDVKAYLQYKIIRSVSSFCTKDLDEEFFDFYSRKLGGQKEQKPFEKRAIRTVNAWLGELMGKIYVSRFFSEEDKEIVHSMVKEVLAIMAKSLERNDWLTNETKAKAQLKLSKFVVKLGYPDKWKSFDKLDIHANDSLFDMSQKVSAFEHDTEFLQKINSVKDKTKWEMNPQDVNAYFHPLNNEIVFPAAIMQPPFYHRRLGDVTFNLSFVPYADQDLLKAINFGGIGAVIAHEITHGYDDQGRKFDGDGNINDWWQEEDAHLFKAKCALMAEQAAKWSYEVADEVGQEATVHTMNAELTMGENLADLGGMSLALQALRKNLGGATSKGDTAAFFYSWANIWRAKQTQANVIQGLASDPHAPPSFRGNLVKNVDAFYETFDVKEGDPMYLAKGKRVQMW